MVSLGLLLYGLSRHLAIDASLSRAIEVSRPSSLRYNDAPMTHRVSLPVQLVVVTATIGSAGCAFTDMTVDIPGPVQASPGLRRGNGRPVMVLGPFASRRHEDRCGMKKNGFNSDTANIRCSTSPEAGLPRLLADGLTAAGFKLLTSRSQVTPSTLVLTGRLDQMFIEANSNFFNSTWETDITLRLKVTTGDGLLAERTFAVKGEEATFLSLSDAQKSFDSAAHKLVIAVVGAVANLSDRFAPSVPAVAFEPANGRVNP